MELSYAINDTCDVEEVESVFIHSGIRRPIGDHERLQRMINNADILITARDGLKLVRFYEKIGFERADKAFVIKRKRH